MDAPFPIRPAQAADVPFVAAIERDSFADPWSPKDFHDCLAAGVPFLVASVEGAVAGYVVAQSGGDIGEILNVGVAHGYRRRGIALALVERVSAALAERGVTSVFLEVRESNAAARALYAKLGFSPVGRRPKYYRRPTEDAMVLRAAISAVRVEA